MLFIRAENVVGARSAQVRSSQATVLWTPNKAADLDRVPL
jgi:hypothetical protein